MKKKIVIAITIIISVILIAYGAYALGFNKGSDNKPLTVTQEILEDAVGDDLVNPEDDPNYVDLGSSTYDEEQNRERNDNDNLKQEKCVDKICLKDVVIYKYNDLNMVVVKGILTNKGNRVIDRFITISYKNEDSIIKKGYYIKKLVTGKEIEFEAQYNEINIFNTTDISLSKASASDIENYEKKLEDGE